MLKKMVLLPIVLFLVSSLFCNIFEPSEIDSSKYYTQTGDFWVLEGKKKMQNQDWQGALLDFEKARTFKNSDGKKYSEAYFYIGKCLLRINEVDLSQVWDEINPGKKSNDVPFLFNPTLAPDSNVMSLIPSGTFKMSMYDFDKKESQILQADTLIDSVFLERKRIYDAMSVAINYLDTIYYCGDEMDGVIMREQYEGDYLIEVSVTVILGISDINNNGKLDYNSNERNAFKILSQDVPNLDNMSFDSLKTLSKNPNEIKDNLDLIIHTLGLADSSYDNFNSELKGANMDTAMVKDIGEMINNFKTILPYFYYNDSSDNDADWFNTNGNSSVDRMVWIDWNGDGLIDIYSPKDTGVYGHIHIGDNAHIQQNPNLYELVDSSDESYKRYIYKGGYCYEFIGGDWGVEEEIMDGLDNDLDGLVDEDTRIVNDSLDDDGDIAVDEEWYDGVDNDGDGLVDEDVNDKRPLESQRDSIIAILTTMGLRG